jgi:hypothetical protein
MSFTLSCVLVGLTTLLGVACVSCKKVSHFHVMRFEVGDDSAFKDVVAYVQTRHVIVQFTCIGALKERLQRLDGEFYALSLFVALKNF